MGQLYNFPNQSPPIENHSEPPHTTKHSDGNGGGSDMLERVKKLEEKMSSIAVDVAILKDKVATKEDIQSNKVELHKELNAQTWKIVVALVVAVTLAVLSKYFIK
ncbi:hypothetical protein [Serratia marcescens]|uniref:hypothetical protein n=1 Tax=Serratia marcescens TaxID=615 RepID=UPI0021AB6223|nr:hypothetical protein [Serratia marcescens]